MLNSAAVRNLSGACNAATVEQEMTGNDAILAHQKYHSKATTKELLMARQRLDLHLRRQNSCGEALCNTKPEQGHVLSLEKDVMLV